MASSIACMQTLMSANLAKNTTAGPSFCKSHGRSNFLGTNISTLNSTSTAHKNKKHRSLKVVAAFGDVSADGTTYLIAGVVAVALLGTAFPILFSRKDLCPECDGAGFVRKSGSLLRANAARKDELQIVCARCNGLGKLNQIDK